MLVFDMRLHRHWIIFVALISAAPATGAARAEAPYAATENFIVGTWIHSAPGSAIMLRLRFGRDKSYEIALLDPQDGRPDKSAPETGTWEIIEPGKVRVHGWRGRVSDVPIRILDANAMIYNGTQYRRSP